MFVQLLLAIISLNYSQGYVLECEFGNEEWINLGIVFQCKVHGMDITSRNSITEVVGSPFRPIRDVRALDVQDQRCQFVPTDVQTFFPNIEGLQVANSELRELQNADMQQFPNLKQLFMSENELQSLENDVFEPCPNIEYVNLGHNNIMHMGTDIFAPLKSLQYCNIAGNSCIDTKMETPNAIQQFSKDVEKMCPPTPEMLKREKERKIPESLRTMAPMTTTTASPDFEDLKEELKKLKNKIAEHDQQIDEIKSKENATSLPDAHVSDVDNSPSMSVQDKPISPEQNVQSSNISPESFNALQNFNRPESPSSSPLDYSLMDILNIPTPNYQQPSYSNQPQSFIPENTDPEMNQCGPYGCFPPNNQQLSPFENISPQTIPNPAQPPNPNSNQFQSPHPTIPSESRLPFQGLQNPLMNPAFSQNVAPEPQTNPSSPNENPPPNIDSANECGQNGCFPSMIMPTAPKRIENSTPLNEPSNGDDENPQDDQKPTRAPYRHLDVESGLSGTFCYVIE